MEAKVVFMNNLDNSVLDNEFYLVIFKKILELRETNCNHSECLS